MDNAYYQDLIAHGVSLSFVIEKLRSEAIATARAEALKLAADGAVTLYEYWHGKTDKSARLHAAIMADKQEGKNAVS